MYRAAQRTRAFEGLLREGKLLRVAIDGERYLISNTFELFFTKDAPAPRGVRLLTLLDIMANVTKLLQIACNNSPRHNFET